MSEARDGATPNEHGAVEDAWVSDGLRVGASLDTAHVVLVLGDDPRRTALAALGVARAQASRRRVALGDLLGDAEPIQELLDGDDPHGLADSFVFGVSLNKIAHAVPKYGDLYVLPSGSEVPAYEDIFTNSRWTRLAAGFRETGALLVVAAPADASHVGDVVRLADGAILVGEAQLADMNREKLLGRVQAPPPNENGGAPGIVDDVIVDDVPVDAPAAVDTPAPPRRTFRLSRPVAALLGVVLALGLGGLGVWLAARPLATGHEPSNVLRRRSMGAAAGAVPSTLDSLRPDSNTANNLPALVPANPADSAGAAGYAVLLARFNTHDGVTLWLQRNQREMPSATFSPILVRGERWYRALAGSYASRPQADSLLARLRQEGQVGAEYGEVVNAPLSFLLDSVMAEAAPALLQYWARRGEPVFALRQSDGSAKLYDGAFSSPQEASLFLDEVRSSGIRPVLVYRIGRVY